MTEAAFLRWLFSYFSYDDCACACMVLHDPDRITNPFQRQCWQEPGQGMQMHEKRCIKRAGVAGIALRAEAANMYAASYVSDTVIAAMHALYCKKRRERLHNVCESH